MVDKNKPAYLDKISADTFSRIKNGIVTALVADKRYKQSDFTAKKLAEMLGTNTRYVSIVIRVSYGVNYASFVNRLRVEEAMSLLADRRYCRLSIEDLSDMVGFSTRQSFYRSFCMIAGIPPREYQEKYLPLSNNVTISNHE